MHMLLSRATTSRHKPTAAGYWDLDTVSQRVESFALSDDLLLSVVMAIVMAIVMAANVVNSKNGP